MNKTIHFFTGLYHHHFCYSWLHFYVTSGLVSQWGTNHDHLDMYTVVTYSRASCVPQKRAQSVKFRVVHPLLRYCGFTSHTLEGMRFCTRWIRGEGLSMS
jgi:hypothetical protein